jgi:hypothetical protein
LCRLLAADEPEAQGIVAIHGDRIAGDSDHVFDAASGRIGQSEFIRWDMPDVDIAYHRLREGHGPPRVVISAVSAQSFGREIRAIARATAGADVAAAVLDIAPRRREYGW